MKNVDCGACAELREDAPGFVKNGVTKAVCNSLKNNTGFSSSNGNNDCEDLDNANDCLIGMMEQELNSFDVCDWKDFMREFIPNLHQIIKAQICAMCGQWTKIENFEDISNRLNCLIAYLTAGHSFKFSEYDTDSDSYIVAGKGVSFLNVSSSGTSSDITIRFISGGMATLTGSLLFYTSDFTDGAACYNYDTNAVDPRNPTTSRKGNSVWDNDPGKPISGGELAYEIRLKKSQYPQIGALYSGLALEGAGGGYHARILVTNEGKYAFGQHGECNVNTGNGVNGGDDGHIVKNGWIYIQMRISYIHQIIGTASGKQYSPYGLLPIRIDADEIDC